MARRRVTYNQLKSLWEFSNVHRNIATGYNKTTQAREYSKRMWEAVALNLNSQGEGAEKDWKGWSKYWNDFKSKLKSKVAAARASQQRTGGGTSSEALLTELELKFLQILGEDFGAGLPGARVEPFDEPILEDSDVVRISEQPLDVDSTNVEVGGGSESILLNVVVPSATQELAAPIPASQPTPPPPPPPVPRSPSPPATPPSPAAAASTPRGRRGRALQSPRSALRSPRRRLRRRELPMTMDTAWRTLITISEQRAAEYRRRNNVLETLVQEITNIKEILTQGSPACHQPTY